MSRVIKFRAWWIERKIMLKEVHDFYDTLGSKDHGNDYEPEHSFGGILEHPDEYAVMQFTGLTDCNGVEIYEGDIVTATCVDQDSCCGATYEYTFCVQWRHHRWYFDDGKDNKRVLGQYPPLKHCSFESCCREGDELKVIGNIYEHPHLLDRSSEQP